MAATVPGITQRQYQPVSGKRLLGSWVLLVEGKLCAEISTLLLDNDPPGVGQSINKDSEASERRALAPETTVSWVQISVLATLPIVWPGGPSRLQLPLWKWTNSSLGS